jgi:hypothetical protein
MGWAGPTDQKPFPSLGWGILDWTYRKLPSPRDDNQPFLFTPEQAIKVVRWYEIDPVTGEFLNLELVDEEAKGSGKSPFAAVLDIAELVGPVCFDGWDRHGEPIGVPWGTGGRPAPWVQVGAVSEDQTDNTYSVVYSLLTARDGAIARELNLDVGVTGTFVRGKAKQRIQPVTASAGSREGQPVTYVTLDETHLWTRQNGGIRLAGTMRRNVAKMGGRVHQTTNAPSLSGGSVAEQSDPDKPAPRILNFARRASPDVDAGWSDQMLLAELEAVYEGRPWANPQRLLAEIRKPSTDWTDALRFFFNIRSAGLSKAIDPKLWDLRAAPRDVPRGTYIALGFDGSQSGDATILRGCLPDGYSFLIGAWERPEGAEDWRVNRTEVHERVEWAFQHYKVGRMYYDPPKWWTEGEMWEAKYGKDREGEPRVRALDTFSQSRMAPAVDRWMVMLREGTHTHDADPLTTRHVKATHREKVRVNAPDLDGRTLYKLTKGDGPEKGRIDATIADVLALEGAMTMLPEPIKPALFVGSA